MDRLAQLTKKQRLLNTYKDALGTSCHLAQLIIFCIFLHSLRREDWFNFAPSWRLYTVDSGQTNKKLMELDEIQLKVISCYESPKVSPILRIPLVWLNTEAQEWCRNTVVTPEHSTLLYKNVDLMKSAEISKPLIQKIETIFGRERVEAALRYRLPGDYDDWDGFWKFIHS